MMAGIKIKTAIQATPQCYAYTLPGDPSRVDVERAQEEMEARDSATVRAWDLTMW